MVEVGVRSGATAAQAMERVNVAVAEALESGVSEEALQTLFINAAKVDNGADGPEHSEYGPVEIYDELPIGLIDVPSAGRKYNLNRGTLRNWLVKGKIKVKGRLKGSATGGGFLLVNESELMEYISKPRQVGGRPRKRLGKLYRTS